MTNIYDLDISEYEINLNLAVKVELKTMYQARRNRVGVYEKYVGLAR